MGFLAPTLAGEWSSSSSCWLGKWPSLLAHLLGEWFSSLAGCLGERAYLTLGWVVESLGLCPSVLMPEPPGLKKTDAGVRGRVWCYPDLMATNLGFQAIEDEISAHDVVICSSCEWLLYLMMLISHVLHYLGYLRSKLPQDGTMHGLSCPDWPILTCSLSLYLPGLVFGRGPGLLIFIKVLTL